MFKPPNNKDNDVFIEINRSQNIAMYHYFEDREMQFDLFDKAEGKKIYCNINVETAKRIRDRLDYFIKYHESE